MQSTQVIILKDKKKPQLLDKILFNNSKSLHIIN